MIALLATLLVGAGIALAAWGVAISKDNRKAALQELLDLELQAPTKSAQELSGLMERAGAFTDRALGKTPIAERLRKTLIRAGSPKTAGEFGGKLAIIAVLASALTFLLSGSPLIALGPAILMPLIGFARLRKKAYKRVLKMETQLPEVLQLVAGSLDSGTSLLVALELAGEEGEEPLSMEIGRMVAECQVGRPLLEALDAMAERVGSKDVAWTAKAIRIQHQTGGKLADTLRILAEFMHARVEVRGEIRALSAEARISGKVLIAMPILISAFFYVARREYMAPMLETRMGHIMIGAGVAGLTIGHLWMKKMVKVEV